MPIRNHQALDHTQIVSIYNEAVGTGFSTADTEPATLVSRKQWFEEHENPHYPILVDTIEGQPEIRGWCSLSPYRKGRYALRHTVEISYYVSKIYHRQGVATLLMENTMLFAKNHGYKTLFAVVLEWNLPSINLLQKHGFEQWGFLPNVADFGGKQCGHLYFGKRIVE